MRRTARWPIAPLTLAAEESGHVVGFVTVVRHSAHAAELHEMAVRPERHRQGVGRALVVELERRLRSEGIEYLQVKTLSASARNDGYLKTLAFYQSLGFRILEEMPTLWDPDHPAVVLVKRV